MKEPQCHIPVFLSFPIVFIQLKQYFCRTENYEVTINFVVVLNSCEYVQIKNTAQVEQKRKELFLVFKSHLCKSLYISLG